MPEHHAAVSTQELPGASKVHVVHREVKSHILALARSTHEDLKLQMPEPNTIPRAENTDSVLATLTHMVVASKKSNICCEETHSHFAQSGTSVIEQLLCCCDQYKRPPSRNDTHYSSFPPNAPGMARSLLGLLLLLPSVLAASYSQQDNIVGSGFNDAFNYEAISDPTHGRVNYVDGNTARSQNLTFAGSDSFILRADFRSTLSPSGPGRNSVRLASKKTYTGGVMIFNMRHMPQGCGTWPAVWTVGSNWPNNGEVDILEGVNDQGTNQGTLHTNAGCTMPDSRSQTGTSLKNNCDVAATNNEGCGVKFTDNRSYGPSFNAAGGGWYAMERTNSAIKIWFWSRNDGNVPAEVRNGAGSINTDSWGTPVANFPSTSCPISSKFGPHNIVINLTFCGDWAGSVYGNSGCPSSCVDYVNNNPSAFQNAYFDFAWIKTYS
ncbi:hypothetical protein AAF712_010326 [Marasmius tenuissimus]|uniref:GH16 domain-containing protein n=1 Tax=Marasmius tenuissimus TaxID=585030 RepID=A0ABR2ZN67_9AGAR